VTASALLVEPAYLTAPSYTRTLGDVVADLAGMVGLDPDPEQRLGLDLLFAMNDADLSAVYEFCVVCARQNLKTGLFKMAALGWLFITDQPLVVWSAHEFSTAKEAHRDMAALIEDCPSLSRRVRNIYYGSGAESIELKSGQRILFKARTARGGRGLSAPKVVLDEAFALRPDHLDALLPTMSVQPDPQVVYGSSAGMVGSESLRRLRDRGRSGISPGLAYVEWCAPQGACESEQCSHELGVAGCALDDVDNWHKANPLLGRTRANGTGLTLDHVALERQSLPPLGFARERLGWWDEPGFAETFGHGMWEACGGDEPSDGLPPVGSLAVAQSMDGLRSAIVAAAPDGDLVHVKPLQHGPGTDWVVARVVELQKQHKVDVVVDNRGPAAWLIPHLDRAGVKLRAADTNDVLDACAGIVDIVRDHRLRHANYPELNDAVAGAVQRTVGERWAWGRRVSTTDISTLEAATLAVWAAANFTRPSVYESRGLVTL
jgi:hypothetical protein